MVSCFRPADAVRNGGASVMSQTLPSEVMIFMVPCGPASLTPSVTMPVMAVTSFTVPPQPRCAKAGIGDAMEMAGGGPAVFLGLAQPLAGPGGYAANHGVLGGREFCTR